MQLKGAKDLRRSVCKAVGHDWKPYSNKDDSGNLCARCKKRVVIRISFPTYDISTKPKIKYADIEVRRFNPLDRAKKRAE